MSVKAFDLIVIGTVPAAGTVAKKSAEDGKSVAVIEANGYGGTCARPISLGIDGEEHVTMNADFFELSDMPKHVNFIGGGYISMEFAHVVARSSSDVVIVDRTTNVRWNSSMRTWWNNFPTTASFLKLFSLRPVWQQLDCQSLKQRNADWILKCASEIRQLGDRSERRGGSERGMKTYLTK